MFVGMDIDVIVGCVSSKFVFCGWMDGVEEVVIDVECCGLFDVVCWLNEVNC